MLFIWFIRQIKNERTFPSSISSNGTDKFISINNRFFVHLLTCCSFSWEIEVGAFIRN